MKTKIGECALVLPERRKAMMFNKKSELRESANCRIRSMLSPKKSDPENQEVYITDSCEVEYDSTLNRFRRDQRVGIRCPDICLTELLGSYTIPFRMAKTRKPRPSEQAKEEFLKPRDAALELRVSYSTIKQWIYKKKIRTIPTAGGYHRIPQSEIDRFLYRTRAKTAPERAITARRLSGRNQLVGRIESVHISGLMAEVVISIGEQQITSIITARSAREMNLKAGQTAAALIKSTEVMILRI